jgi:hypothetical protein
MSQIHFSAQGEAVPFNFNALQVKACAENKAAEAKL